MLFELRSFTPFDFLADHFSNFIIYRFFRVLIKVYPDHISCFPIRIVSCGSLFSVAFVFFKLFSLLSMPNDTKPFNESIFFIQSNKKATILLLSLPSSHWLLNQYKRLRIIKTLVFIICVIVMPIRIHS